MKKNTLYLGCYPWHCAGYHTPVGGFSVAESIAILNEMTPDWRTLTLESANDGAYPPSSSGEFHFDTLNPAQRYAVNKLDGPLLVLAGAGTGKTRVLTSRIAQILFTRRAYPSQILAVTFTNKAANEMKLRIRKLVGDAAETMPWLGTFHSIGAKILRYHAELVGLKRDFSILDVDDQIRLLKSLTAEYDIDDKRWPAKQLAACIDNWKNRGLNPDRVPPSEADNYANGMGITLYTAYQAKLRLLQAVDFGDLLLLCCTLFNEQPMILQEYQNRFRFILVDEYQDANTAQYLWLRMLTREDSNICCVGDDDQSIYGWRGAEVDHILHFQRHFPTAELIRLEHNYRSTAHILDAASYLIAHNISRLGKNLYANQDDPGEKVHISGYWNDEQEACSISDEIGHLLAAGHKINEIAILVRASFQMRSFEDSLMVSGIPYRVVGGPRFYERAEIRDVLAYLKLIISPENDLAFTRIINTPRRGLGSSSLLTLQQRAKLSGIPITEAARICCETGEVKSKPAKILQDLLAKFQHWRTMLDVMPPAQLASILLEESGYLDMWNQDKSPDAPGRLENLKELLRSIEPFSHLSEFLEHVSLVTDIDRTATHEDCVSIMTLHAAKGLEFDIVFLPGWEEGLFPHQRSLDEHTSGSGRDGLEEERRLAYVGLTRARKLAKISFTKNRRIHGTWQSAMPSRFIAELPESNVILEEDLLNQGLYKYNRRQEFGDYSGEDFQDVELLGHDENRCHVAGSTRYASSPSSRETFHSSRKPEQNIPSSPKCLDYASGDAVFHLKFGNGRIISVDGNKLTIYFDKAGQKRVISSFVTRR